jgi:hypothetical protein
VKFGATAATWYQVLSDTVILAQAPAGSAGTVDITVTTPSGTSATGSADHFSYNAAPVPSITSISPTTGTTAGNTAVILTGSGFTGATGVNFGNYPATTFVVNSDTELTVLSPPQGTGTVDINVTTPAGTSATGSADKFTYTLGAAPSVTAVTPNSGSHNGGTIVTISGSHFSGATQVLFGTTPAASFTVYADGTIVAPAHAAGTVDVTVTTYGGTSSTSSADQYTFSSTFAPVRVGGGDGHHHAGGPRPAVLGGQRGPRSGATGGASVNPILSLNYPVSMPTGFGPPPLAPAGPALNFGGRPGGSDEGPWAAAAAGFGEAAPSSWQTFETILAPDRFRAAPQEPAAENVPED